MADFRIHCWDRRLSTYVKQLEKKLQKPVVLCGDLNVAHRPHDMHHLNARLAKLPGGIERCGINVSTDPTELRSQYVGNTGLMSSAGCTPQERASFSRFLSEASLCDLFVQCHGASSAGHFSYYSGRFPKNRTLNRGLRLDYFLGSTTPESPLREAVPEENSTAMLGGCLRVMDCRIASSEPSLSDHVPIVLELECPVQKI